MRSIKETRPQAKFWGLYILYIILYYINYKNGFNEAGIETPINPNEKIKKWIINKRDIKKTNITRQNKRPEPNPTKIMGKGGKFSRESVEEEAAWVSIIIFGQMTPAQFQRWRGVALFRLRSREGGGSRGGGVEVSRQK